MRHRWLWLCLALIATSPHGAAAEWSLRDLLAFLGITDTPKVKGPKTGAGGDIWVWSSSREVRQRLTFEGKYTSPVFADNDEIVVALKATRVESVSVHGGATRLLAEVPGVVRLLGARRDMRQQVLLLRENADGLNLAWLEIESGVIEPIVVSGDLEPLRTSLWDFKAHTLSLTGGAPGQGTDVQLTVKGENATRNVTECGPARCTEPALSADRQSVAYVRSE